MPNCTFRDGAVAEINPKSAFCMLVCGLRKFTDEGILRLREVKERVRERSRRHLFAEAPPAPDSV